MYLHVSVCAAVLYFYERRIEHLLVHVHVHLKAPFTIKFKKY